MAFAVAVGPPKITGRSLINSFWAGSIAALFPLISIEEIADPEPEVQTDAQQIANALSQLPQETLDALKNALGL